MGVNFPSNPEHGTIYEPQPGVFYIYDLSTKTWVRAEGGIPNVATPLASGLMLSEDLYKLNRIVVPPPQTTLTAQDCAGILGGGIIEFKTGDQFLTIEGTAKLMNEVAGIGNSDAQIVTRELHQHTNSFDFRVDTDIFYEYMESTGKFRVISTKGIKGPPGDIGQPGKDNLPHGPKGLSGNAGANALFDVNLEVDPISLEKKSTSHRAIVGFDIENISEDENYLLAYRAAIGNPDACPSDIRLTSSLESNWVVCIPSTPVDAVFGINECFTCTGDLYYIDISLILQSIENEFDRQVLTLKTGMESIVSFWMTIMSGVFDEQKSSLCCAIEYCRSQSRNQDARRYIEQSRIQAAQSDHSIIIEGDPDENTKSVTIMEPSCLPDGFGTDNDNGLPNNQDPIGGRYCVPFIMIDEDGKPIKYSDCPAGFTPRPIYREYILAQEDTGSTQFYGQSTIDKAVADILAQPIDGVEVVQVNTDEQMINELSVQDAPMPASLILKIDPNEHKSMSGDLAKGRYFVNVSGLIEIDGQYTAGLVIYYKSDGPKTRHIPDILSSDKDDLSKAYRSLFVQIDHDGGQVTVSINTPEYATGSLEVSFSSGKKAERRKDQILKNVKMPRTKKLDAAETSRTRFGYCEITSDYLRWYEKCWKLRKCSGAVVELSGQDFIIIFRDDSKIACAPATIAYPTLDGENFVPSTGKIMFDNMLKLERKVLDILSTGKYKTKVGNLSDITKIYFPLA